MKIWTIDSLHTDAAFLIKHLGIMNLRGSFGHVTGRVEFDDTYSIASVESIIDVKSISTRNEQRDLQLLTDDFFYAEKFPEIHSQSKNITKLGENYYEVEGDLNLKGLSQPVTLEVTVTAPIADPFGLQRIGLEAKAQIDRRDFGIHFNQKLEDGGLFIGNKVTITIDGELTTELVNP